MGGLFVIALSNEVISGWLFMDVLSINPQAGKQSYRFEQFSKRECKTFIATKSDSDRRVTVRGKDTAVVQIDFWPSPPPPPPSPPSITTKGFFRQIFVVGGWWWDQWSNS